MVLETAQVLPGSRVFDRQPQPEVETPFLQEQAQSMYLLNTRVFMNQLRMQLGRGEDLTVEDISDSELDSLCAGYDAIWCLGIYQPSDFSRKQGGKFGRDVSSAFAIAGYEPNPLIARNWEEWDQFVDKLHLKGVKVFLDFVPNHVARDHPWIQTHPDYFIHDDQGAIAYGMDPNYRGNPWVDTAQLDYSNPNVRGEMKNILLELVDHCDGVRCDVAMLEDPETFKGTWGRDMNPFWPEAIAAVKQKALDMGKEFTFLAEAYWDFQELLQAGFDLLYDHEYYGNIDKLQRGEISPDAFKAHLRVLDRHFVTYMENQDEARARRRFGKDAAQAAMIMTACLPTIWLAHEGEEEGRERHVDMQEDHFRDDTLPDPETQALHRRLVALRQTKLFRQGTWFVPDLLDGGRIIPQQWISESNGAVICTNFSAPQEAGRVILPENAVNIWVFNVNTGMKVDPIAPVETITSDDGRRQKTLFVDLQGWESQIVYYDIL